MYYSELFLVFSLFITAILVIGNYIARANTEEDKKALKDIERRDMEAGNPARLADMMARMDKAVQNLED